MTNHRKSLSIGLSPMAWRRLKSRIDFLPQTEFLDFELKLLTIYPSTTDRKYYRTAIDALICDFDEIRHQRSVWIKPVYNLPVIVYSETSDPVAEQYCHKYGIKSYWALNECSDNLMILTLDNLFRQKQVKRQSWNYPDFVNQINTTADLRIFRLISDLVPCSILITDARGNISYVNKELCRVTGYIEQELIGKTPNIFKSGEHQPEFYNSMWQVIAKGESWKGEICNRDKSGRRYWERIFILPALDNSGHPSHYISIRIDDVEGRNIESLNMIRELSGGIAHQFSQPLQALTITLDMMEEKFGTDSDFQRIKNATHKMSSLIHNLKNLTQLNKMDYLHEKIIDIPASARQDEQVALVLDE
jgi:PAS domain S-box-containing protein